MASGLLELYGRVRAGHRLPDDAANPLVGQLRLTGVTRSEGGYLRVRNRIYQRVFDRRWVREHLPAAERTRQWAARRRGVLSGVAMTVVAVVIGIHATTAIRHARSSAARMAE